MPVEEGIDVGDAHHARREHPVNLGKLAAVDVVLAGESASATLPQQSRRAGRTQRVGRTRLRDSWRAIVEFQLLRL